jgi:ATP-dependent metalloprotease
MKLIHYFRILLFKCRGSRRGFYEHSSSRATINQFLAEIDGFEPLDNVIVIGATNHEKDLDSAAVRPGRFDKKIFIHPPDENGRTQVLEFYISKINLKKDQLVPNKLSKMTPGFTGADIENVINISVINAVNKDKEEVTVEEFGEARDRVLMGISRKNYNVSDKKRFLTSLHEAGHTLICYKSEFCRKNLHKVTIIPRGPAEGVVCIH